MTGPSLVLLTSLAAAGAAWWAVGPPPPLPAATGPHAPHPPRRSAARLRVMAALGAAALAWALAPLPVVTSPAVGAATWWWSRSWRSREEQRRADRLDAQLPHVVDLLVAMLASGAAPTAAVAKVAVVAPEPSRAALAPWAARVAMGSDPHVVWTQIAAHPQLGRLGAALVRAGESGAPVLGALERLSEDLRAGRRAAVEVRVRRVSVAAVAPVTVCLLPAFVLIGIVPLLAGAAAGLGLGG